MERLMRETGLRGLSRDKAPRTTQPAAETGRPADLVDRDFASPVRTADQPANAQPGTLNPYRVVAEPLFDHFIDEEDPERAWRREKALAAATRRRLVLDVLTGLLPYDVARMQQTRTGRFNGHTPPASETSRRRAWLNIDHGSRPR